jgi:hypothetical protein
LATSGPENLESRKVKSFRNSSAGQSFERRRQTRVEGESDLQPLVNTFLTNKMKTTWKEIAPVPTSQEFIDIVLSRTQRKLPTQIRAGFKISRIRSMLTIKARGVHN